MSLTVLSGPAGVGKSSIVARVRRDHPQIWVSVSATTRPPRPGEVDGVDRVFLSEPEFQRLMAAGELFVPVNYAGNWYATPKRPVDEKLAAGVPVLMEIDLTGAREIAVLRPDARRIFLAPPSWAELERRLRGRGTEDAAVIARRLAVARDELAAEPEFDLTIVNSTVEEATARLVALMLGD